MDKNYFLALANYNIWANQIVIDWLEQITDEQWTMSLVSSFNSVQETVLHIISAENVWVSRFQHIENPEWLQATFKGSKDEHIAKWKNVSQNLKSAIEKVTDETLAAPLQYKRLNGQVFNTPLYQLLAHVFNHSTYHRGQLVTLLRQAGFTNIGSTDLLNFQRN
jgi:uncharacterized damage-inducible protein DinB